LVIAVPPVTDSSFLLGELIAGDAGTVSCVDANPKADAAVLAGGTHHGIRDEAMAIERPPADSVVRGSFDAGPARADGVGVHAVSR
jgi:hypothetical protein